MNVPIIVIAFNRSDTLKRLLNTLAQSYYDDENIKLIISIDKGDNEDVYKVSDEFVWRHGEKQVIKHQKKLGLRAHVLQCGDFVLNHDAVIILEDDLYTMIYPPYFHHLYKS